MPRKTFLVALTLALLFGAGEGWAAPTITSFTVDQTSIDLKVPTNVTFTIVISGLAGGQSVDPSGQLDVLDLTGKFKTYAKARLTKVGAIVDGVGTYRTTVSIMETTGGTLRLRFQVTIKPIDLRISSDTPETCTPCKVQIAKGKDLFPQNPLEILLGDGSVTATVSPTTVGGRLHAAVGAAADGVVPPRPGLIRERVLDVIFEEKHPDANPLNAPIKVKIPTTAANGTCFIFAEQTVVDGSAGGLVTGFIGLTAGCAVSTPMGNIIETNESGLVDPPLPINFPGIFGQGRRFVEVFRLSGSGVVSGTVTSIGGAPRAGVRVTNLVENKYYFYTDANGNYTLPVDGSNYQIDALDATRCRNKTSTAASFSKKQASATVNLVLDTLNPPLTRQGIQNASFEAGNLDCWTVVTGSASAVLGSSSTYKDLFGLNATIKPSEEDSDMANEAYMMAMTPASGTAEASQRFTLPARIFQDGTSNPEAQKLQFDFSFGCPSSPCPPTGADLSSITLTAEVRTVSPDSLIGNFSQTFKSFGGAFGWRTGEIPIRDGSATPAVADGTELKVVFRATGLPTGTAALIDNVRLDTVMVSAHRVGTGAGATAAQIRAQMRAANEILSQAGLSVRLRRIKDWTAALPTTNPACTFSISGDLKTVDYGTTTNTTSGKYVRTDEMKQLTCLGANDNADIPDSDVLAYYVDSFTGNSTVWGLALTAEDYESNGGTTSIVGPAPARKTLGIIINNLSSSADRQRETLAHELGHFLLRPTAPDSREHGAAAADVTTNNVCTPVNFGTQSICSARPLFISTQTQQVDNKDAPFPAACPLFCKK